MTTVQQIYLGLMFSIGGLLAYVLASEEFLNIVVQ